MPDDEIAAQDTDTSATDQEPIDDATETEADADGDAGDQDEDDAGDDEAEGGDETVPGARPQDELTGRRAGGARERIQGLSREVRAAKEEAEAARREAREARDEAARVRQRDSEAEYRERYALMTPEEQRADDRRRDREEMDRRLGGIELRSADREDKAEFRALCAEAPHYQAIRQEVEERLQKIRATGQNIPREALAKFIIGERAVERAGRAGSRQRKQAETRVERQTARPSGARSDVAGARRETTRGDTPEARRKRLENATF